MADPKSSSPTASDAGSAPAATATLHPADPPHTIPHDTPASASDTAASTGAAPSTVGLAASPQLMPAYLGAYAHPGAPTHQPPTSRYGAAVPQIAASEEITLSDLTAPTADVATKAKDALSSGGDATASAATKVAAGIAAVFAGQAQNVPSLSGDEIMAAQAIIETFAAPPVANFVKAIFGLGGPITAPYETNLNSYLIAGLHILRAMIATLKF